MKKTVLVFAACLCAAASFAQIKYPATKQVDSTNTYFGVTYHDQYQWLENFKDSTVISWFKQQANLTNSVLNTISGRDELIAEWKALDKLQPARINGRKYQAGKVFYRKTIPGEKVGKLYYRVGMNGPEQLLFDPLTFIKGKTLTIDEYAPSYDAKRIAIGYSEQGAEVPHIKVMDIATKQFLPDDLYPTAGLLGWTFDNKAILYLAIKTDNNADPEARLNPKTKLHVVGADSKADIDFFSNGSYPELHIDKSVYPYVTLTEDNKNYVFAGESTVQPEMKMYYAPISQINAGKIQWKVLAALDDELVRGMEFVGDKVFAISHKDALNYKLLQTDLLNPDWKTAKVIAAEKKDQTLESITHCKDYVLLNYSDGINTHIFKYNVLSGKTTELKLPYTGTAYSFCLNNKTNTCTVGITSWSKPYTEFDVDVTTEVFTPGIFNKAPVYPAAYRNMVVKEVEVKGHDGVMIPLSIIHKAGIKMDGNNVCLMDSYGAYGSSMSPYFDVVELALAVKGTVIAIPHVRGGSEKGQAWYKAGYKTTKPNTWKDFNSCAEYLIAQGYTKPSKLAGTGTSAGGILITRAITERPDLYAAAICNVGCANAMRLEFSSNGPVNIPEFGTVKDSVECKALYEMDGMQHVVAGTKYPAVICVGGWNDPRVIAWQPGKFAAAVQNASTS
ncbi:MAG: prolyl oligopeptidase family serine peptidase, partial [Mucilaginibacter sp.]